ncbi:MAG: hypothetical protein SPE59_06965 [Treponema sp.]|nr:hypothetical protein [Treponema sp.]
MKKTKVISALAMLLATSALVFTSCGGGSDATGGDVDTPVEQPSGTGDNTTGGTGDNKPDTPAEEKPAGTEDTGSASDLEAYTYKRSLLNENFADSWGSGTGITNADGKSTLTSGNLWGAGGVCGVQKVELGEIARYNYIVFTLDTTNYTISEYKKELESNTGVNVKVPNIIVRPSKYYTVDGKTTYYIPTSEFSNASEATEIALIVGGEGTLVLEEFYLAAESEPVAEEITYSNATVYTAGDKLEFENWDVGISAECKNEGIVATGKSAYYAVKCSKPIHFKTGAKLEVTYTANKDWKVKPVAPEVETVLEAGTNVTKTVDLGNAAALTKVGLVLGTEDVNVTITSIKVIDNE